MPDAHDDSITAAACALIDSEIPWHPSRLGTTSPRDVPALYGNVDTAMLIYLLAQTQLQVVYLTSLQDV